MISLSNTTEEQRGSIQRFQDVIKNCKQDACADYIQNFFAHWFLAKNENDQNRLKALYADLLDPKISSKITIAPQFITSFKENNADRSEGVFNITPYEINRIFLHAIYNDPADWESNTPGFAALFKASLDYAKNSMRHSSARAAWLTRDSYPEELMAQLTYLSEQWDFQNIAGSTKPDRPNSNTMILLPAHIKTAEDWIYVSKFMSLQVRKEYYQILEGFLKKKLASYCVDRYKLKAVLLSLRLDQAQGFFIELGAVRLGALIPNVAILYETLKGLVGGVYPLFFDALGPENVDRIFLDIISLSSFLKLLPIDKYEIFFEVLGAEKRNALISSLYHLGGVLDYLPVDKCREFLKILGAAKINELIPDVFELMKLYTNYFASEDHEKFCQIIGFEMLCVFIPNADALGKALVVIENSDFKYFFKILSPKRIEEIIPDATALTIVLNNISKAKYVDFFNALGADRINALISDLSAWSIVLNYFYDAQCILELSSIFANFFKGRSLFTSVAEFSMLFNYFSSREYVLFCTILCVNDVKALFPTVQKLGELLEKIPEKRYPEFLNTLGVEKINALIPSAKELREVLCYLSSARFQIALFQALGAEKIRALMLNVYQLGFTLNGLEIDTCSALLKILGVEKIKTLIPSAVELGEVLSCLSDNNYVIFIHAWGMKKTLTLISSASQLGVVLSKLPSMSYRKFFNVLGEVQVKRIIPDISELAKCLSELSGNDFEAFFGVFGISKIDTLIFGPYQLGIVLYFLSNLKYTAFFNAFGVAKINEFISSIDKLIIVLSWLSSSLQCEAFFDAFDIMKVNNFIVGPEEFADFLNISNDSNYAAFIQILDVSQPDRLVPGALEFRQVLSILSEEKYPMFLQWLGADKISALVSSASSLGVILERMSSVKCAAFLQSLGTQMLHSLFKNAAMLGDFFLQLRNLDYAAFFRAFGSEKLNELTSDIKTFNRVYSFIVEPKGKQLMLATCLSVDCLTELYQPKRSGSNSSTSSSFASSVGMFRSQSSEASFNAYTSALSERDLQKRCIILTKYMQNPENTGKRFYQALASRFGEEAFGVQKSVRAEYWVFGGGVK